MSKRNRRKKKDDTNYVTCLLMHGAKPRGVGELHAYKDAVRAWWMEINKDMNPPIKEKAAYRFWSKYIRWYNNMMTNERREMRCALTIVEKWTRVGSGSVCCPTCQELTCECDL